jgi:hypothetical protein
MLQWEKLVWMPEEELGQLDIAETHLACAAGLPGAEAIDYRRCITRINELTESVRSFTDHCLRNRGVEPGETEAQTRMRILATCLWQGEGIRYNPAKIASNATFELADKYLHGALFGEGGTCATLPVLYTAIGRRLGYPLKLARGWSPKAEHLFCRWDAEGGERFNVEVNNTGVCFPDDEHYREHGLDPYREKVGRYLQSLTPKEELAGFLRERAFLWRDAGNLRWCVGTLGWSAAQVPHMAIARDTLRANQDLWFKEQQVIQPPRFPRTLLTLYERRYPDTLPVRLEQDVISLEVRDTILKDRKFNEQWWNPLRRGDVSVCSPNMVNIHSYARRVEFSFQFSA